MGVVPPLPFHPADPSFNRANALYLAHASDVAYDRAPAAAAAERLGLRAVAFRHKVTRTRGYLGVCDTHAVLAFRGSDPLTLPAWVTDAVVRLVGRDEYAGRVHLGFSSVLRRTWGRIDGLLADAATRPLFITGHSMGGALAVLAACRLASAGRPPVAIYTFGSPRVGDAAFCDGYTLPTYRVVYGLDLIPELPLGPGKRLPLTGLPLAGRLVAAKGLPAVKRLAALKRIAALRRLPPGSRRPARKQFLGRVGRQPGQAPGYGHVKTFVYLGRDGTVTADAVVEPWHTHAVARAIVTRGKSFHEGLSDHLLSSYIRALEAGDYGRPTVGRPRLRPAEDG